jgi:hypothetical protein
MSKVINNYRKVSVTQVIVNVRDFYPLLVSDYGELRMIKTGNWQLAIVMWDYGVRSQRGAHSTQ